MTQGQLDANDRGIWEWLALRAEARLQGQLTAAIAADQRAMVWSGMLAAAVAALASAAAVCLSSSPPKTELGHTAALGAAGLIVSLLFSILAARPAVWFFPGSEPDNWMNDIHGRRDSAAAMKEFCADLSDMIRKNEQLMALNGKMLMISVYCAFATLAVCVVALGQITLA